MWAEKQAWVEHDLWNDEGFPAKVVTPSETICTSMSREKVRYSLSLWTEVTLGVGHAELDDQPRRAILVCRITNQQDLDIAELEL